MHAIHADIRQVARTLWQGWVREYDLHASAPTRGELVDEMHRQVEEGYFGSGDFLMIVTTC